MSQGQRTSVSNAQLKHLLKLSDAYEIKAESGEWEVEKGTYQAIKKAGEHVRCEMAKQSRQRKRTMNITYIPEVERRGMISEENLRED